MFTVVTLAPIAKFRPLRLIFGHCVCTSTHHEAAHVVVDVDLPVGEGEEQESGIRRPADSGQLRTLQLLAPDPVSVNGSDDDRSVLFNGL